MSLNLYQDEIPPRLPEPVLGRYFPSLVAAGRAFYFSMSLVQFRQLNDIKILAFYPLSISMEYVKRAFYRLKDCLIPGRPELPDEVWLALQGSHRALGVISSFRIDPNSPPTRDAGIVSVSDVLAARQMQTVLHNILMNYSIHS